MNRIFPLIVALSSFLCGCVLTWLYLGYTRPTDVEAFNPSYDVAILRERSSLLDGIVPTVRGCGNGYGQGYGLPDGKKLGEGNACYSSFKEANREMQIWLKKSDKIIYRVAASKRGG